MTHDDETRLAEIEQRLAAATPGPWLVQRDSVDERTIRAQGPVVSGVIATVHLAWVHSDQRVEQAANAEFIAHARADLEWAIGCLRSTPTPDIEAQQAVVRLLNRTATDADRQIARRWATDGHPSINPPDHG